MWVRTVQSQPNVTVTYSSVYNKSIVYHKSQFKDTNGALFRNNRVETKLKGNAGLRTFQVTVFRAREMGSAARPETNLQIAYNFSMNDPRRYERQLTV